MSLVKLQSLEEKLNTASFTEHHQENITTSANPRAIMQALIVMSVIPDHREGF